MNRRLAWYYRRVRVMSPRELRFRVGEAVRKRLDRFRVPTVPEWDSVEWPEFPGIAAGAFSERFPAATRRAIDVAEEICLHRFRFLGVESVHGPTIDWTRDPRSGASWPMDHWTQLDFRHSSRRGDVKFVWELNRLQHWPRLALASALTDDARFGEEIFLQLESWLQQNPYPRGINWASGIELGLRLVSLSFALELLGPLPVSADRRQNVYEFVWLHCRHLLRYPSRFSSANNHALAEALGLLVAGATFPNLAEADTWWRRGREVLDSELPRQLYPDGGSFEHSTHYLQAVLEMALIYLRTCRRLEIGCPREIVARIEAALTVLVSLMDESGNLPRIGDSDDGCALSLQARFDEEESALSLLQTGALLLRRGDLLPPDTDLDPKAFLLAGESLGATWPALTARAAPERASRYFPDVGLAVIRDEDHEVVFVGNSGRLGAEPLAAHGHADALSFWLSVGGHPVFVDSGTYVYNDRDPAWREYFRGTRAHNTLTVDGEDQAVMTSPFVFTGFYRILEPQLEIGDGEVIWSAGHDGYRRLGDPLIHRRTVRWCGPCGQLSIVDQLECRSRHSVQARLHLHPRVEARQTEEGLAIAVGNRALSVAVGAAWTRRKLLRGCRSPLAGWYSDAYHRLEPTACLLLEATIDGTAALNTTIRLGDG